VGCGADHASHHVARDVEWGVMRRCSDDWVRPAGSRCRLGVVSWIQDRAGHRKRAASVAGLKYDVLKPSRLLDPTRGVVQFTGRTTELADLVAWCEDDHATRLRLISGPAGVGKTRLGLQLAARMTEVGWHCVHVGDGRESSAVADVRSAYSGRALLLVDYAETRSEMADLLRAVASDDGLTLRVLLLERSTGPWWSQLGAAEPAVRDLLVAAGPDGDVLESALDADLTDADLFHGAVRDFAAEIGIQPVPDVNLVRPSGRASILELHAAALVAVLNAAEAPEGRAANVELTGVLDELLRHEERFWVGTAKAQSLMTGPTGLTAATLCQVVAANSLLGAANENDALDLLSRVPDVVPTTKIAQWLRGVYPPATGSGDWLGSLQPDRLAELLVSRELEKSQALAERCLTSLNDRQARRAVVTLARASADYEAAAQVLETLLPLVSDVVVSIDAPIETLPR
jgi:hypothetical protein